MDEPPENEGWETYKQRAISKYHQLRRKVPRVVRQVFLRLERHNAIVTAFGTLVIAIFTVVLALATLELKKLGEKQATDTSTLANATLQQAEAAKNQVTAMQGQLAVMANAQRPWIAFVGDASAGTPLKFGKEGGGVNIKVVIKNIGNVPAFNVFVGTGPYVVHNVFSQADLKEFCDGTKQASLTGQDNQVGQTVIFPNDESPVERRATFSQADEDRATTVSSFLDLFVWVCIAYRTPDQKGVHATGLIYGMAIRDLPTGQARAIDRVDVPVPQETIIFNREMTYAD